MPTIVNNDVTNSGFGTSVARALTFTPTAGNTLIVVSNGQTVPVTSVTDNLSSTYTLDVQSDEAQQIFRLSDIPSGITSLTISHASNATPRIFVFEVSGLAGDASVVDATIPWASTPESFSSSHSFAYTASGPGIVFAAAKASASASWTGASGSVAYALDDSENRGVISKVVSSAETSAVNWTHVNTPSNQAIAVVYAAAAGGPTNLKRPLVGPGGLVGRNGGLIHVG